MGNKKSFGLIVLLVVMGVVLLLVSKAWNKIAPTALDVHAASGSTTVHDHGQPDAAEALRSGDRPDLSEARRRTSAQAAQTAEALAASED